MDTIFTDLSTLIKKHLSSCELITLFQVKDISYCKSIKEACRRFDWSWILYYLQYYRFQISCLKEGYHGSLETGNIELISFFESLHPDVKNDRLQVKYIAKSGNIDRLNEYFTEKGDNLIYEYWFLLEGIIKTHNSHCLNIYKNAIIQNFYSYGPNFAIATIRYATKYNNKQVLNFIKENLINGEITDYDSGIGESLINACDIFVSRLEVSDSQLNSVRITIPHWTNVMAEVGRIDICSRFISSTIGEYNREIIVGAIKGHQQQILDLFDLKNPSVISDFCCGYIEVRDYEKFCYYYDQLNKEQKNAYNQFFVVTAIRKCNYKALKLLLEDSDINKTKLQPGIVWTKDINTAIVLSKHLNKFEYNINRAVRKLNSVGYDKVAEILLAAHNAQ